LTLGVGSQARYDFLAKASNQYQIVFDLLPSDPPKAGGAFIAIELWRSDGSCIIHSIVSVGNKAVTATIRPTKEQERSPPLPLIPLGRIVEVPQVQQTTTGTIIYPHRQVVVPGPCKSTTVFRCERNSEYILSMVVLTASGFEPQMEARVILRRTE
jgi:hypothetical protein